jgi:hypothetical protein
MVADEMTQRITEVSPRFRARIAGLFGLLMILSGGLASLAIRGLVVKGDATATATNIMAHERLFRLSYVGELFLVAFYVVFTALLYDLLKPVNQRVSLLAAFFSLVGCAIQGFACVFELAPLVVLGRAPYLGVFKVEQLQSLAFLFLRLYSQAYSIAIVFFAFYLLVIGYLVFKSTFLPRILGVLVSFAGLSWMTFLSPPLGSKYLPYIIAMAAGEGFLYLWLLVMGVNSERWWERAEAAEQSRSRHSARIEVAQ